MKTEEIIRALRCSATKKECKGCPYSTREDVTNTIFEDMADYKQGGRYYIVNCDTDKLCKDAAAALEFMKNSTVVVVAHPNGYKALLKGDSTMTIMHDGKEVLHTYSRNVNTAEEIYNLLETMPEFMKDLWENENEKN